MFCTGCGTRLVEGSRFCAQCGATAVPIGAAPSGPVQGVGPGQLLSKQLSWRSGLQYGDRPAEIWAVIFMIGFATALLGWPGLRLVQAGGRTLQFSAGLGLAFVLLGFAVLVLAAALGSVAYLVYRGEPEAWGLALVAAALLVAQILWVVLSSSLTLDKATTLLILLAIAWGVALLLPASHEWFAAREAVRPLQRPLDVAISHRLCWVLLVLTALNSLAMLFLSTQLANAGGGSGAARAWFATLLMVGAATGFFVGRRRMAERSAAVQTRNVITAASAAAALAVLVWHDYGARSNAFLVSTAIVAAALLWARPPVREYFSAQS